MWSFPGGYSRNPSVRLLFKTPDVWGFATFRDAFVSWFHPNETTIYKWLFGVPGSYTWCQYISINPTGSSHQPSLQVLASIPSDAVADEFGAGGTRTNHGNGTPKIISCTWRMGSQDVVQSFMTMVSLEVLCRIGVVGPLLNGHSWLINGGDPNRLLNEMILQVSVSRQKNDILRKPQKRWHVSFWSWGSLVIFSMSFSSFGGKNDGLVIILHPHSMEKDVPGIFKWYIQYYQVIIFYLQLVARILTWVNP